MVKSKYICVCVSCEPLNVRRYRGKSFTDLCFCESSKLTRWMRVSFNIQQNKMVWKKKSYLAVRCDRCLDPSTKWMPQHTSRQHLVHQCLTSSSIHRTWIANYISRTWLSKNVFENTKINFDSTKMANRYNRINSRDNSIQWIINSYFN